MRCSKATRAVLTRAVILACLGNACLHAAEIVRHYPMGENDNGASVGKVTFFTADIVEFATDGVDEIVDLEGEGTYVKGRNDDSPFAISFDGVDDFFFSERFDPRDFNGSFTALSQGWIRADSSARGTEQTVWALGSDNGGVSITMDGFWQLNSGGSAGSLKSTTEVAFDEWVHVAVHRTGNNGNLYVNGSLAGRNNGFWNGPGDVVVGANNADSPENLFKGQIDEFILTGFGDGVPFDAAVDLKFLGPDDLSGVLGDVDQNGTVNQADYNTWSANVGFNNELGLGDFSTLFRGDVDQNGRVNFFDFQIIRREAMAAGNMLIVPEPSGWCLLWIPLIALTVVRRSSR